MTKITQDFGEEQRCVLKMNTLPQKKLHSVLSTQRSIMSTCVDFWSNFDFWCQRHSWWFFWKHLIWLHLGKMSKSSTHVLKIWSNCLFHFCTTLPIMPFYKTHFTLLVLLRPGRRQHFPTPQCKYQTEALGIKLQTSTTSLDKLSQVQIICHILAKFVRFK